MNICRLREAVEPHLKKIDSLRDVRRIEPLGTPADVTDGTVQAVLRGSREASLAVVLCSSPAAPGLVARDVTNAAAAKRMLGERLGSVILDPLVAGEIDGLSFAIFPWHRPCSNSRIVWAAERPLLGARVLGWLHAAATATASRADVPAEFVTPLQHLEQQEFLSASIRRDVTFALERLSAGAWRPSHTLDHNDLWRGNILTRSKARARSSGSYPFAVIDWAGENLRGYGLFDLIRWCHSIRIGRRRVARDVRLLCEALGCEQAAAMGHILGK